MELYANLHTHSTHSDGQYTPGELVRVAKAEGYKAIAITDHDTATAYPELKEACEKEGLECLFATEFSVLEPKEYHIVAFDFDPEYPPMKEYLWQMGERQTDNTKHCFDAAVAKGAVSGITWEEVLEFNKGISWIANNHVYKAMIAKGLVKKENYIKWFQADFNHQRALYPPLYPFKTLPEIVKLVKDAGGFCILAHPHNCLDDIDYFIECGIVGIEVLHRDLTDDEQKRALKIALEKNLFISGGSDHYGLCGGCYSSYPTDEELKKSRHYIPELSTGVLREHYEEIKNRKLNR